ncbi:MAG: HAD-IIIC family phosphatase [Drouetiella hepatica Uher 2000/2452]|jgi:FkbH-like protein|uniref:HAD-IIIC family phosphatase n=1 Tax=Drouetiella hepatica Uher 2000/2452 TaxID=904376 RepID=A0A951QDY3_9CYAN|nr:HAD-IIIC family phosphatase [Drouetiella hepatica Uher 2000/2452]
MISLTSGQSENKRDSSKPIKCVVWDLDNTLWHGVLLEDEQVFLREDVVSIIKTLDSRGILQSLVSKNEYAKAMSKLEDLGLHDYFLYPQINWNTKSSSIQQIAQSINIGVDSIAFIDDQPFEREEVSFSLPDILCIDAANLEQLLEMPEMNPCFITEDAKQRRLMYLSDIKRKQEEEEFVGSSAEFLATLKMSLTIASAQEDDLQRAEELTVRTNQLNTTGYTYSYEELDYFRQSDQHKLLIASLNDKYGTYGTIGLVLVDCQVSLWTIKLLLMSCRVMSRGVGTVMLHYLMQLAQQHNVRLCAEFVANDRNRIMYITYKFAGFKEIEKTGNRVMFEHDLTHIQPYPNYMNLEIRDR